MLEYAKTILGKVSFDRGLFEKELVKALETLINPELKDLKKWCYHHFGSVYGQILNRHLSHITV